MPILFLSHFGSDTEAAKAIKRRIEDSPAAKEAGLKVWFDEWEIRLGDPIYSRVRDGLERSRILLLFMSRNVLGSSATTMSSELLTQMQQVVDQSPQRVLDQCGGPPERASS